MDKRQRWKEACLREHRDFGLGPGKVGPLMTRGLDCPSWYTDLEAWRWAQRWFLEAVQRNPAGPYSEFA